MGNTGKCVNPIDQKKLLEDCDLEQAYANRCLHLFARGTEADMRIIASALADGDLPHVARIAHRIKGASATIRAEFLRVRAAKLEGLAESGDPDVARECFRSLQAEFERFNEYIAALLRVDD